MVVTATSTPVALDRVPASVTVLDGAALRAVASGTTRVLNGVHAMARGSALIIGYGGTVLRWDGAALSQVIDNAANVHLEQIVFYPLDDQTTMMNLYKSGEVDATYNHTVPASWLKSGVRFLKEG